MQFNFEFCQPSNVMQHIQCTKIQNKGNLLQILQTGCFFVSSMQRHTCTLMSAGTDTEYQQLS